MIAAKSSPLLGGEQVIAFAPAWMVSRIVSSFGPPVARIGMFGNCARMRRTICGVAAAPDTLRKSAPASIRLRMSIWSETIVAITGMSTTSLMREMTSLEIGALTTTPKAP